MTNCPFYDCSKGFQNTGAARNHLQLEHDVPCHRANVHEILAMLGADVPDIFLEDVSPDQKEVYNLTAEAYAKADSEAHGKALLYLGAAMREMEQQKVKPE